MPVIPQNVELTTRSVDILNAIRNSSTANYRNYVPVADDSLDSIRAIGAVIMQYPALQNEFLSALVNRIGMVLITSKSYTNPWAALKRGMLNFGETIEEIFVNIAKPFQFDPAVAEEKFMKREIPDVRAAFHIMNYQKYYKHTVSQDQLRQAFLSWSGISDLIAKIVDAMYTGANYDEFQTMKYLLARHILNGELYPVQINTSDLKSVVTQVKSISNKFTFLSTKYNLTGVSNRVEKTDQYVIVNADFDAAMDVEVLAAAFNMEKAEFMGHRILVDGFGSLDTDRLSQLFANDSSYEPLTADELLALEAIPAVLLDRDWFMIFDNYQNFTEQYNGEGLYWQYWYHVWKTFSVSPFANAAVFVPGAPAITSVEVSPSAISCYQGQHVLLDATVVTANFATKAVNWSISDDDGGKIQISPLGDVIVAADATAGEYTITAKSVLDSTKSDTCTLTVVAQE